MGRELRNSSWLILFKEGCWIYSGYADFFMPAFAWSHTLWHGGLQWFESHLSNHKPGFDRWRGKKWPQTQVWLNQGLTFNLHFCLPGLKIINRFNQLQLWYSVEQVIITPLNVTVPHPTLFVTLLSPYLARLAYLLHIPNVGLRPPFSHHLINNKLGFDG